MASEEIPQLDALRLYLTMIAGTESSGYFEIRCKRPNGHGMAQDWISLYETTRAAKAIANRGRMNDTYVGVAPRRTRAGGLDAIERAWCLWVDCDSHDSLRKLAAFDPLPSIVIRSGSDGHAHAYWPLRTSIKPAWAKRCNQRLALRLGGDRGATDAARILRPPGTFNFKHAPERPVECTRLELRLFDWPDVVGALPDPQAYTQPAPAPLRPLGEPGRVLAGLIRTVSDSPDGNRNNALHWAACRAVDHDLGDDAREQLRHAAISRGLPEHEVDRTIASAYERQAAA